MTNVYYELAVEKGFHDNDERDENGKPTPRQMLAWLALARSEEDEMKLADHEWSIDEHGKPHGKVSEAADIVIRCQDTISACGFDFPVKNELVYPAESKSRPQHCSLKTWLWHAANERARDGDVMGFAEMMSLICNQFYISLDVLCYPEKGPMYYINAKHEYNKTRPRMHGRKI